MSLVPALFSSSSDPAATGSLTLLQLLRLPHSRSRSKSKLPSGPIRSPLQPGSAMERREGMLGHSATRPAKTLTTCVCLSTQI